MRKAFYYLPLLALILMTPVVAVASVHINSPWIQNAGTPPAGTLGTSWWSTTPAAARSDISASGCAITCFAMAASNNTSINGNPSNPYGVWLENGKSCYTLWTRLAPAYGLYTDPGDSFVEMGGHPAKDKATTLKRIIDMGQYAVGKLEVPGQRDHWVLFTGTTLLNAKLVEELGTGEVIPPTYDSPEKGRMLPLKMNPYIAGQESMAATPYDEMFMICDPCWVSPYKGGPWINFTANSKGASLDHLVRVKVLARP